MSALIRERQQDGIERAKREGKHPGRPQMDDQLKVDVVVLVQVGNSKPATAEKFGIGVSTVTVRRNR